MWNKLRNSTLVTSFRGLLPNWLVCYAYHLPKSILANIIYGFPSRKLKVIGITGTKGKTSTAHLIHHILLSNDKKTMLISTLSAKLGKESIDTGLHVTNPNPFQLQKFLNLAVNKGCEYAVLEVTSHGLTQFRNWGIQFDIGIITQVTADHISYHGGIEKYKSAKAKLVKASKLALLNKDDPSFSYYEKFAANFGIPIETYQAQNKDFNLQNEEAAVKTATLLGIAKNKAVKSLYSFKGVPGRMEFVKEKPFKVVIDFAHTPDSLKASLELLRKKVKKNGKLIAVLGCAGERDPGRRKVGAIAAKFADIFIITAEDPRTESLETINQTISDFALKEGAKEVKPADLNQDNEHTIFARISDRQKAIIAAINIASPGDVVGLFGKGHEQSMCF